LKIINTFCGADCRFQFLYIIKKPPFNLIILYNFIFSYL
jgi:hypothetical protein